MLRIEERLKSSRLYYLAFKISESSLFTGFMAMSIIINTFILALDRYPINLQQTVILEKVNIMFTMIFTVEMIVKIIAVGCTNYFRGGAFNIFDSIIVISSIIDIFLSNIVIVSDSQSSSGSVITALRGFRLLRIFKLARSWKRFELLLETLGRTLVDIAYFSILLFLFIFIFTLMGLELFANKCKINLSLDQVDLVNGESPMSNFDNFFNSFTTVFVVLTNDNESQIYYDHYRTVGGAPATVFFILLIIIG